MLRAVVSLAALAGGAAASAASVCGASCAVEEDAQEAVAAVDAQRSLLQVKRRSQSIDQDGEQQIEPTEFTLDVEEFRENALKAIEGKLEAAGHRLLEPRYLTATTANGTTLAWEPRGVDFPLHFRYQGKPGPPSALLEGGGGATWHFGWFDHTGPSPESTAYTPTRDDLDMMRLSFNVYFPQSVEPKVTMPKDGCHFGLTCGDRTAYWGKPPDGWTEELFHGFPSLDIFGSGARINTFPGADWGKLPGGETDNVALYTNGDTCALAFSGTKDDGDWQTDMDAFLVHDFCGVGGFHRGFAKETANIVYNARFKAFSEKLKTCSRRIITGHSLGGAMAALVAECINFPQARDHKKPEYLRGIGEVELFTYGAPAMRTTTPTNMRSSDGAFKGKRFFNFDTYSICSNRYCAPGCCAMPWGTANQDPVPWVTVPLGYHHPKMDAVGLDKRDWHKNELWRERQEATPNEPDHAMMPDPDEHQPWEYVRRLGGDPTSPRG